MDRVHLQGLTLSQLKREAAAYGLSVVSDRDRLIETILEHFEQHAPALDNLVTERARDGTGNREDGTTASVAPDPTAASSAPCAQPSSASLDFLV